jgi:hypothetical protein
VSGPEKITILVLLGFWGAAGNSVGAGEGSLEYRDAHPLDYSQLPPVTPGDDPRAWGLSPMLLARLGEKSGEYETTALRFTCQESVERTRYRQHSSSGSETSRAAYLLAHDPVTGEWVEHRASRVGPRGAPTRPTPLPYEWTFLFLPKNQPYFAYRKVDAAWDGFSRAATIQFRGALPFRTGSDIREWEGIATVDIDTGALLKIVAVQRDETVRLSALRRKYLRRVKISFGLLGGPPLVFTRFGRPIDIRRITLEFVAVKPTLTLPGDVREDVMKITEKGLRPLVTIHRSYTAYRFFETRTREVNVDRR